MSWIKITPTESIPLREGRAVNVGGEEIAIFNMGDRFLAIQNRCPHSQGPLADGIVSGNTVVCPLHQWKTCLESGEVQRPKDTGHCVKTFDTKVEDNIVLIRPSCKAEVPARSTADMELAR
jgi:nitrite reductase (NADH) small subunit